MQQTFEKGYRVRVVGHHPWMPHRAGRINGGRAAAILTGNGLKDPDTAVQQYAPTVVTAGTTVESIEKALGW